MPENSFKYRKDNLDQLWPVLQDGQGVDGKSLTGTTLNYWEVGGTTKNTNISTNGEIYDNADQTNNSSFMFFEFDDPSFRLNARAPVLVNNYNYSLTNGDMRFEGIIRGIFSRLTPKNIKLYQNALSLINRGTFTNSDIKYSDLSDDTKIEQILDIRLNVEEQNNKTEIRYFFNSVGEMYQNFLETNIDDIFKNSIKNSNGKNLDLIRTDFYSKASGYSENRYEGSNKNLTLIQEDVTRLAQSMGTYFNASSNPEQFLENFIAFKSLNSLDDFDDDLFKNISYLVNLNDFVTTKIKDVQQRLISYAGRIRRFIILSRLTEGKAPATAADLDKLKAEIQQGKIDASKVAAATAIATQAADAAQKALVQSEQREAFELTRFNVQCFMLDFIDKFVEKNNTVRQETIKITNQLPHNGKILLSKGKSYEIVNKIFGTEKKVSFLELSNEKLSYLVPKINLSKVHFGADGTTPIDYQIPFSTNAGWSDSRNSNNLLETIYESPIIKSKEFAPLSDREFGVGIKSFNWDYEGSNPVSARKDITATLTLKALSFDALCREFPIYSMDNSTPLKFRYIDLVLRTGPKFYNTNKQGVNSVFGVKNSNYNPHYFRYRIDLGFQELVKNGGVPVSFTDDEIQAVNENNVSLALTLIDHKFIFNQDGSINLEIKYRAYFEAVMNDNEADILATREILQARTEREAKLQELQEKCEGEFENDSDREASTQELKKIYEDFAKISFQELKSSYGRIIQSLRDKNKIYYALIDKAKLGGYSVSGRNAAFITGTQPTGSASQSGNLIDFNPSVAPATTNNPPPAPSNITSNDSKDKVKQKINEFLQTIAPEEQNGKILISYFFLSDLLECMLDNIIDVINANGSPNSHINLHSRILLGSMAVDVNGQQQTISIGDIPISIDYFSEWFLNRVVAEKRTVYHILTFLRDLSSHMITDLFGSKCSSAYNRSPSKIQMTNFILRSTGQGNGQEFFKANKGYADNGVFDFGSNNTNGLVAALRANRTIIQAASSQYLFHYTMIYALTTNEIEERNPLTPAFDYKLGIYHIGYGRNKGIVKKLDFERTEIKGLRELNFIREFDGRGLSQLQSTYNANVTTVGSYLFFPGERVYIDPTGFGNSIGNPTEIGSIANDLGLGGYHYIYRVSNSITPGKFETNFKAKWESSGASPKNKKITPSKARISGRPVDLGACTSLVAVTKSTYVDKIDPLEKASKAVNSAEAALLKPEPVSGASDSSVTDYNIKVRQATKEVETEIQNGTISPTASEAEIKQQIESRIQPEGNNKSSVPSPGLPTGARRPSF